jgi:hypothetical protein
MAAGSVLTRAGDAKGSAPFEDAKAKSRAEKLQLFEAKPAEPAPSA